MTLSYSVAYCGDELKFVAAVAYGGYARGQIDRSPLHLFEVRMHVPETGKQELSFRINDVCVFRNFHFAARTDSHYETLVDDDC